LVRDVQILFVFLKFQFLIFARKLGTMKYIFFSFTFGKRWVSIKIEKGHFWVSTVHYSLASCHVMLCSLNDAFRKALLNYGRINKVTEWYWFVHHPLTLDCSAGKEYLNFTESQLSLVSTSPPAHPLLR
jgi:hypothetical protein